MFGKQPTINKKVLLRENGPRLQQGLSIPHFIEDYEAHSTNGFIGYLHRF